MTHKTADDHSHRADQEAIVSLVETSFADWRTASPDRKDNLLLSGAALVWAERWLLTRPSEVSGVMKAYIQRSIAARLKKSTSEEDARRREIERKERTYNRILIVASLMALAFLGPKTLREAGVFDRQTARPPAGSAAEIAVPATVNGQHRAVLASRPGQHHIDALGDGSIEEGVAAEGGPRPASKALVKLATAYGLRGDRRTGYLLAAEYVQSAYEPETKAATDEAQPQPKRSRKVNPNARQWSDLPTELSDAMNALSSRTSLELPRDERLTYHRPFVTCGKGARVAGVSESGALTIWDAAAGRRVFGLGRRSGVASSKAIDRACGQLATTTDDYEVVVTSLRDGTRRVLGRHGADVFAFSFDEAGARLATVARDGGIKVWDVVKGNAIASFNLVDDVAGGAVLSGDGRRLVTWTDAKIVAVRDVTTGALLGSLEGHASALVGAEFSDDGAQILTISLDGSAILWNGSTYQALVRYMPKAGSVVQVRLSDDLGKAAIITDDGDVVIWDNRRRIAIKTLSIAHQIMVDAAFNAEGTLAATVDETGHIGIWDIDSGKLRLGLSTQGEGVAALSFSTDSSTLFATTLDGSVTEWPLMISEDAALTLVRRHADACLTQVERSRLRLPGRAPEWCKSIASR